MLKQIIIISMLLALVGGPMVLAIEKTRPSNNPAPRNQDPKTEPSPRQERPSNRPADSVDYDHFIDRNNNGIDDRAEQTRQKSPDKPSSEKPDPPKGSMPPRDSADSTKN